MFLLQYEISKQQYGGMPEWLIGAVLKTVVPSRVPRVRIPIPPPFKTILTDGLFCCNEKGQLPFNRTFYY